MVPGVADLWRDPQQQAPGQRMLATPEQLRQQLTGMRNKHAVIVLVVDLLDSSGSFLPRVRDLVGKNPVVIVGTKVPPSIPNTVIALLQLWFRLIFAVSVLCILTAARICTTVVRAIMHQWWQPCQPVAPLICHKQ